MATASPMISLPPLFSCGHQLSSDDDKLGAMEPSDPYGEDRETLWRRMEDNGYLLLRGLLPRSEVLDARKWVTDRLAAEDQLDPAFASIEGVTRPGSKLSFHPELAQKENAPLQRLLYRPDGALMSFFRTFLGGPIRHFDYTWLRCLAPGRGTPAHCDIVYMGRGTRRLFTTWVPLGDVTYAMGGLTVLEGSHRNERLRATYGQKDVDVYCSNRDNDDALTANGTNGWLSEDPNRIRSSLGGRWLVSEYAPGDAVIFCMDLVHGGLDNRSDRIRLSSDSRYQLASEPADERWIGDNPIGHGSAGKRGRIC